jgi:hypothetical protein
MARWTASRRKAHSKRIKALRADPAGPYAQAAARLAQSHADGRHPGFGRDRTRMTDEERREAQRLATMRWRARRDGRPITKNMLPKTDTVAWSVAEAGKRLDAPLARGAREAHHAIVTGPLFELWTIRAVEYVPVKSLPGMARDESIYPVLGASIAGWGAIHGHPTRALNTIPR